TPCLAEPKQLHSAYCQIKVFKALIEKSKLIKNVPRKELIKESSQAGTNSPSPSNDEICLFDALLAETTPNETADWLRRQRFSHFMKAFFNFSGTDLLRLSRDDTIRICGVPDGIRLFNALQYKRLEPKLTLYMCVPGAPAYHAVFLKALTLTELVRKVCDLIQVQSSQIYDVYCQGPDGINVHVNDEVVQNLVDKSRFIIDAMKCGEESDSYRILLKSAGDCS
uniref:SAM domain-containing protein n=1 Tax=Romanomermis culicivorax TaxID=13658 RepID=A0A915IV68_ROMCU